MKEYIIHIQREEGEDVRLSLERQASIIFENCRIGNPKEVKVVLRERYAPNVQANDLLSLEWRASLEKEEKGG